MVLKKESHHFILACKKDNKGVEEIEAVRSEKCVKSDYLQIFGLIHLDSCPT